jgi:mannosyltransferase
MVQTADGTGEATPAPSAGHRASRTRLTFERIDYLLVLIVVLAAALRFWHISTPSLWYDEYVTSVNLHQSLGQMVIVTIPELEGTPPLSLVLGWFWTHTLGDGDGVMRALYALEGIATVPVVYLLVKELRLSRRIALIAALLVAVNPMLVWYSHEARSYALLALLGTLSIYCWARVRNDDSTGNFVWWGVVAALAVCTHYFAILVILPEAVWLAIQFRTQLRKLAIGCIPLVAMGLPLIWLALRQQGKKQSWISDFPIGQRLAEAGRSYVLGAAQPFPGWWPLGAVVVVAAAIGAAFLANRSERSTAGAMFVLGSVGFALALAASAVGSDYFLGRNLIVSLVPFVVIVAIGLGNQRVGWLGVIVALVLSLGWVAAVAETVNNSDLQKADWRAVSHVVDHGPRARAVVVDSYLGEPLLRYVHNSRALRPKKQVDVDAIDLVYRVPDPKLHCGRWSGLACEAFLFPTLPKPLAKDFELVDRQELEGFVVNRYESRRKVTVNPKMLLTDPKVRRGFVLLPNERQQTTRQPRARHHDQD